MSDRSSPILTAFLLMPSETEREPWRDLVALPRRDQDSSFLTFTPNQSAMFRLGGISFSTPSCSFGSRRSCNGPTGTRARLVPVFRDHIHLTRRSSESSLLRFALGSTRPG